MEGSEVEKGNLNEPGVPFEGGAVGKMPLENGKLKSGSAGEAPRTRTT